ncbi:MAG: PssD/Cps14F family polysaccharide biosynthesis glycosyltransferase [Planctomycetota bacterium]|jgi:UDP-N-acetylglucosamine:LPS N-acetylglucosamine transferase|nr:PssD/Cps14F family polysaccharide biosynthesis glycosyltransferase [Planctomycetota bacterium]MDP6940493.1 PssD/Cps14F family polysaccharide biosynthesis glycosyltransferase [Planctomycetota bacterium]
MKLALVTSTGGHLLEMMNLREAWEGHERFFVTFPLQDAKTLLDGEKVYWAYHPTNRSLKNLIRNVWLAWKILRKERPDVVVSTGAGPAVPFIWLGRMMGMRTVYLECITRIHSISMAGKMILPAVDKFYGQWEELAELHPKIDYDGRNV